MGALTSLLGIEEAQYFNLKKAIALEEEEREEREEREKLKKRLKRSNKGRKEGKEGKEAKEGKTGRRGGGGGRERLTSSSLSVQPISRLLSDASVEIPEKPPLLGDEEGEEDS